MEIINVNESNFDEVVGQGYVLVDFYATWCGPCKMMHPVLESIANARDNIQIAKVDVDQQEDLAKKYGVMSIPTLILFKDGQVVSQKIGFIAEPLLIEWINENR